MPALSAFGNKNERAVVPMRYSLKKHRAEPAVPLLDRLEPGVHTLPSFSSHSSRPSTAAVWDLGLIDENRLPPLQLPVAPLLTPADSLGLVRVRNFGDNSFLEAEVSLPSELSAGGRCVNVCGSGEIPQWRRGFRLHSSIN
jgi:hypothetical protein